MEQHEEEIKENKGEVYKENIYIEFFQEFLKLNPQNQKIVSEIIHKLKKTQDMYSE